MQLRQRICFAEVHSTKGATSPLRNSLGGVFSTRSYSSRVSFNPFLTQSTAKIKIESLHYGLLPLRRRSATFTNFSQVTRPWELTSNHLPSRRKSSKSNKCTKAS